MILTTDMIDRAARALWDMDYTIPWDAATITQCEDYTDQARRVLHAVMDTTPTTSDETGQHNPAHDIDWQEVAERHEDEIQNLIAELERHRTMAALWKATAREHITRGRTYTGFCEAAEASFTLVADQRDKARAQIDRQAHNARQDQAAIDRLQEKVEKAQADAKGWMATAEDWQETAEAWEQAAQLREAERDAAVDELADHENCPTTARELLGAAWGAAHVPEGGVIPAGAETLVRYHDGRMNVALAMSEKCRASGVGHERRLLDAPARPAWADLADVLGDFAVADEHNGTRNDMVLARRLHERGVRVTGGDDL